MSKQNKIFILQFIVFAVPFIIGKIILSFTDIEGIINPIICAAFATCVAPQFKMIKSKEGEQVYMRWFFSKTAKKLNW